MNIFMLGWEFPPFISGGLGTACYGLTRALNTLGHHVIFVLPQSVSTTEFSTHVKLKTPDAAPGAAREEAYRRFRLQEFENVSFRAVPSEMQPYAQPGVEWRSDIAKGSDIIEESSTAPAGQVAPEAVQMPTPAAPPRPSGPVMAGQYGGNMFEEAERYARVAVEIAVQESFDVIHAHDWMTFPAGMAVAAATGKPLVIHVHSTEFDRSGEHVNQGIYDIERRGVHRADRTIAVSHLTRSILLSRYAAPADRVEVVYNAIQNGDEKSELPMPPPIRGDEKIVLFLGRITMQKGPEYFIAAAKKVLELEPNVRFVVAGSGDMTRRIIEMAAELGIGHKVLFTGFLRGDDVARVFRMADLYVMPSVSEPFGIAPLEALSNDVPVLISRQSGVSEILTHALKVDFWDIDEMANKIIAVLRHPPLRATLRHHGTFEIKKLSWTDSANNCIAVYQRAIRSTGARRYR